MRVSYDWLGDFVDLEGLTPRDAADLLTGVGMEVEAVEVVDLREILVGRVLEQAAHPRSNKPLWIHQVDVGRQAPVQIIAGAPNAVAGSLVPVALPGTTVPNGTLVRDARIAGYDARGMLCSEDELKLGVDREAGIMLLDSGEPGQSLSTLYPLDAVLHLEINSNRPDCLGTFGLARELAAAARRPLKRDFMPAFLGQAEPAAADLARVTIEDPGLCRRYIAAAVTGLRVGPSPRWLQRRLRMVGLRPISNVVDITNYVQMEYAQPLHAFDMARLTGPEIRVRRAREGETLLCLDGETRRLTAEMLVIADAEVVVGIAGVIGGMDTAVNSQTAQIVLESASFDAISVRATSRALGLRTEASSRFERNLAPELALAGARRAAALLTEVAGGQVHREWPDIYPRPQEPVQVRVWPARVDALLGAHIPLEEAEGALRRLGFQVRVQEDGAWDVLAPVFRLDVGMPEDIVEEVGRIYGYDKVPGTVPGARHASWTPYRPSQDRRLDAAREVLVGAGYTETVNPSLVSASLSARLGLSDRQLIVANPISDEQNALRTSLLPSLAQAAVLNRNRERPDVRLFELGSAYLASAGGSPALPDEPVRLAALAPAASGAAANREAFMAMKSVLDRCVRQLSAPMPAYTRTLATLFHPGRCAAVEVAGRHLGYLGELHPAAVRELDLSGRPVAFELDVLPLLELGAARQVTALPRLPSAGRDLAVVVAEDVPAANLMDTIRAAAGAELESLQAFDEYRGEQVGAGYKNVAFRLVFRSPERTFTGSEVDSRLDSIRRALERDHGGRLRA